MAAGREGQNVHMFWGSSTAVKGLVSCLYMLNVMGTGDTYRDISSS